MRFGFHISISGGFSKVVEKAEIRGCENIQFFSRNPNGLIVKWLHAVTQTNHLPFDRLKASGDILKTCNFSGHAEPFDFPFALRLSKGERFAQPPAQRASGSERTGLSKHEIDFGNSLVMGDDTRIEARGSKNEARASRFYSRVSIRASTTTNVIFKLTIRASLPTGPGPYRGRGRQVYLDRITKPLFSN